LFTKREKLLGDKGHDTDIIVNDMDCMKEISQIISENGVTKRKMKYVNRIP